MAGASGGRKVGPAGSGRVATATAGGSRITVLVIEEGTGAEGGEGGGGAVVKTGPGASEASRTGRGGGGGGGELLLGGGASFFLGVAAFSTGGTANLPEESKIFLSPGEIVHRIGLGTTFSAAAGFFLGTSSFCLAGASLFSSILLLAFFLELLESFSGGGGGRPGIWGFPGAVLLFPEVVGWPLISRC